MLCWTDPPYQADPQEPLETALFDPDLEETPDTDARLINDLDLRVIAPDSGELEPWAPDFTNPLEATPTGDNTRDNVEQIIIPTPVAGTYLVQVTHKGTLRSWEKVGETSDYRLVSNQYQAFSLALSGNFDPKPNRLSLKLELIDVQAGGDLINFSFDPVIGLRYQLESSNDLTQWTPDGDPFHATLSPQPLTRFYTGENQTKRFYRIRMITPLEFTN
jgi:hypothetical protein